MKDFLIRLFLAIALTLVALAVMPPTDAQQADEDPAPATPQQRKNKATPQIPNQQQSNPQDHVDENETKEPAAPADDETQNALTFTGRVIEEKGALVLHDPVTKMSYQLDDPLKARAFVGKQVKILGKLNMKSNTIQVDTVELTH